MNTNDVHSLVGAYVLDAVDELERAAFERHVGECPSCQAELDELRETASRMADSTWSIPPPQLRTDVMAAIGRTRQLPPPDSGGLAPGSGDELSRRRDSRVRRWTVAAAAAVVLAAGTGTTVWTVQDHRVREQRDIVAAAEAREARIQSILSSPDVVTRSGAIRGGGRITVASSASHSAAVVLVGASTAPSRDEAFQLWAVHGSTMTNAGVLAAGEASAVRIVENLPGSDGVGVTLEPAGGSTEPTFPPVAQVSLT